jgi:hypothetical protein
MSEYHLFYDNRSNQVILKKIRNDTQQPTPPPSIISQTNSSNHIYHELHDELQDDVQQMEQKLTQLISKKTKEEIQQLQEQTRFRDLTPINLEQLMNSEIFMIQRGPPGLQGESIQGPRGPQGVQGSIGPQGIPGIQGPIGHPGLKGLPGPRGFIGPQGNMGPQGDMGEIGFTGPQGDKGDKGDKGEKGDEGRNVFFMKHLFALRKMMIPEYQHKLQITHDFMISINRNSQLLSSSIPFFDSFYLPSPSQDIHTRFMPDPVNQFLVQPTIHHSDPSNIEYFPLDYLPNGILLKIPNDNIFHLHHLQFQIFQTLHQQSDIFYQFHQNHQLESTGRFPIVGFIIRNGQTIGVDVELELSFELHHYIPHIHYVKRNDLTHLYPYFNPEFPNWNPMNTCISKPYSVLIQSTQEYLPSIQLPIPPNIPSQQLSLFLKIKIPPSTIQKLKYKNKNNEDDYGFIPFFSISCSFISPTDSI